MPVQGDEIKVRRIGQNLLLNAMKYTWRGGIRVDWGGSAASDDGRWWFARGGHRARLSCRPRRAAGQALGDGPPAR